MLHVQPPGPIARPTFAVRESGQRFWIVAVGSAGADEEMGESPEPDDPGSRRSMRRPAARRESLTRSTTPASICFVAEEQICDGIALTAAATASRPMPRPPRVGWNSSTPSRASAPSSTDRRRSRFVPRRGSGGLASGIRRSSKRAAISASQAATSSSSPRRIEALDQSGGEIATVQKSSDKRTRPLPAIPELGRDMAFGIPPRGILTRGASTTNAELVKRKGDSRPRPHKLPCCLSPDRRYNSFPSLGMCARRAPARGLALTLLRMRP